MCIDIYAPGRALTQIFQAEQVWLRPKGANIEQIEVFDCLLRLDDGEPELDEFFFVSPHFCRFQNKGVWRDAVAVTGVDDHLSLWGWFYWDKASRDPNTGILTLKIPSALNAEDRADIPLLQGNEFQSAHVQWDDRLESDDHLTLMRQIKKSLFKVQFAPALKPYGANQIWFRFILKPIELNLDPPSRPLDASPLDCILPYYSLWAHISSPLHVRKTIGNSLQNLEGKPSDLHAAIASLKSILVFNGFQAPGTLTRIEDQRLMLCSEGRLRINLDGGPPPTVAHMGTEYFDISLPKRLPWEKQKGGESRIEDQEYKSCHPLVHSWLGGSVRNVKVDLAAVVTAICMEASYGAPKKKEQLASSMTPELYREGCTLIDNMVDVGLLKINSSEDYVIAFDTTQKFQEGLCKIRRMYQDSSHFTGFPQARTAFQDIHTFRIDYFCSWFRKSWWRPICLYVIALAGVISLVINLLRLFQ